MTEEAKKIMEYYDNGLSISSIADLTICSLERVDKIVAHQLQLRANKAAKRAEKNAPIVLAYERLKSVKKTAKELNLTVGQVYKVLKDENIELERRADTTTERRKQIVEDYRCGESVAEISEKYKISKTAVYNALEIKKIPLQKTSRRTEKTDNIVKDILSSARYRGWKSELAKKYGISRQRVDQIIKYYQLE